MNIVAVYVEYVAPPVKHVLTIGSTIYGTTQPAPGNYEFTEGEIVPVSAIPEPGYMLDHLELDGVNVGTAPMPYPVTMDKAHTLYAVFAEIPPPPPTRYNLTISTTIGGTTAPVPDTWQFDENSSILVKAIPDDTHSFDHWELDGVTYKDNPITVIMSANRVLHAVFTLKPPPIPAWQAASLWLAVFGTVGTGTALVKG